MAWRHLSSGTVGRNGGLPVEPSGPRDAIAQESAHQRQLFDNGSFRELVPPGAHRGKGQERNHAYQEELESGKVGVQARDPFFVY